MTKLWINGGRALLLGAVLAAPSLLASDGHGQVRSSTDINYESSEKVQHLLSDNGTEDADAVRQVFELGSKAVPTLIEDLQKEQYLERTSRALAYLGGPREHNFLFQAVANQKDPERKGLIAGFMAGALVKPASPEEWKFLENCTKRHNDETESPASLSAVLALGMNQSPRAVQILRALVSQAKESGFDKDVIEMAQQAIRRSNEKTSSAVTATDEGSESDRIKRTVLRRMFFARSEPASVSFDNISFTEDRTRALVSVEVRARNGNPQGYDVVLQRDGERWTIVGTWFSWAG